MWSDGEWANYCNRSSRPIPQPLNGGEFIVNDTTDNTSGFSKGYGGLWNNTCTGKDPTCRHWYEANQGLGSHTYHTIANGNTTIDNWAKWQPPLAPLVGVNFSEIYEIFVYIPTISAYSNDTFTWQAKFKAKDAAGQIREAIVDEYSGRDRWLSIGMYYMDAYSYVYVTDATGEAQNTHCLSGPSGWCRMTADAVKFVRRGVAHLSDVRTTNGDTESLVVISNNGGGTASVKVSPFNSTGSYAGYYAFSVGKGNQVVLSMSNGGIATARVSANQDVVVVVENQLSTGGDWAYNGVATSDPLNPGWGQTGTTIYAPVNMNNYWTWYSNLYLYNTSTSNTNVDLVATNDEGGTISINDIYVPANNRLLYAPFVVQNELYAAKITNDANAPLSAVVVQNSENIYETYNAFSSGATKFYAPLIMSNYYYWNTSVNIQNISTSTATVTIKYYRDTGSTPVRTNTINIPKDQTRSLYSPDEGLPDLDPNRPGVNFIGSATITSNQNVVVVINQSMSGAGRGLSYSAVSSGNNYVVLPDLLYHVNDLKPGGTSNENWMTSVNILNLEDHSTQVFLNFDQYCWINRTLDKYGSVSWMLDGCGPDSHRGPGIVYTNDGSKIAVVVNHSSANYSNDLAHSYTGVNR